MKTVREVANDLGVSKTRILQIINQLPPTIKPKIIDKKYSLTDKNIRDIESFIKKPNKKINSKVSDKLSESNREFIESLKKQNNDQLKQIEQLQKLLEQQQILLLNEQKEKQLLLNKIPESKVSFWNKLKFFKKEK